MNPLDDAKFHRDLVLFRNMESQSSSSVGAIARVKRRENKFTFPLVKGFWVNKTDQGTFAHDAEWSPSGVKSAMAAKVNFDDHTWFLRLCTSGNAAVALQWQLNQRVKATINTQTNFADLRQGLTKKPEWGLRFDVEY